MSEEYIKKEDAIGIVKNLKRFSCFGDDGFVEIPMVYCELMQVASADVAPVRHGRWEKNDDYTCSLCGYRMVIGDGAYNYCPHCGARMDGEEKNCDTCKHYDKWWDDIICDGCTKAHSNWERKDDES